MSELVREIVEVNAFIEGDEDNPLLTVEAEGLAATTGWTAVRLDAHVYITPPEDGYQDFDLVGDRPAETSADALTPVEAAWEGPLDDWVVGVRVHAIDNLVEDEIFEFEEEDDADSEAA
ncbi:hypothetical protein EEB18_003255 [Sphingopyxis sp. OPL5]|uniref:hypothetical protein n=1 Tax=unclassified Sphingopyxis TaxID=2614943 RepID=UPI0006FEA039|nr:MULTISPECIES: hypothetical protein [unclassified Sphingopyxis]KQZ60950.1 hypothetical protein ASD67_16805 [Sphingopyxis sp. Root1497]OHD03257.1 MAG: hypothetical protein A2885_05960 [Sphingopyxis sp. RIFCSPHIGHO2_01_FULL_65_24]QNO28003.1 hypothetical protein EEB18_003255 [Sphingopyxis sp. OPL5]